MTHYCFVWDAGPFLLWSHVQANLTTFVAYMAISIGLTKVYGLAKERIPFGPEVGGFAAFIFLCGVTHLATVLTTFWPSPETYAVRDGIDVLTSFVSIYVAYVVLWKFSFLLQWVRRLDRSVRGDVPIASEKT
jgi:prepilin signal peptidase PulO-like enzyme (type II secretory pathway)